MTHKIIELPIHFDVPEHYINIDDFVSFSIDVKNIISELNKKFFDGKQKIEIVILPSEEGSLLKKIGILGAVIGVPTWAFLESDIGKAYIKGLTGHEPAYFAEISGEKTLAGIRLIKDATIGFLEKDDKDLDKIGITEQDFPSSYEAKSDFYETCIKNPDIEAIEFSNVGDFDIKREQFPNKIPKRTKLGIEDEDPPKYKLHELIIISSVNIGHNFTQWRTQDKNTKEAISFYLEDQNFLKDFLDGKYPLKESEVDDIITVLIEYKKVLIDGDKKMRRNAIKIYKFNDKEIEPIPSNLTIETIYNAKNRLSADQMNLSF